VALESISPRRAEDYHFRLPALILVPLFALVLQAYLPLYINFATILNLPLLVVIYFALSRCSPTAGLLAGALIGVAQDSLSRGPIGLFEISDTVIGFVTPFVSARVDTESPGIRLLTIFILYYLHSACFYLLASVLPGEGAELIMGKNLVGAVVNALSGVVLFELLDRFRKPS
jgi:rod shape-determining protein MreD